MSQLSNSKGILFPRYFAFDMNTCMSILVAQRAFEVVTKHNVIILGTRSRIEEEIEKRSESSGGEQWRTIYNRRLVRRRLRQDHGGERRRRAVLSQVERLSRVAGHHFRRYTRRGGLRRRYSRLRFRAHQGTQTRPLCLFRLLQVKSGVEEMEKCRRNGKSAIPLHLWQNQGI